MQKADAVPVLAVALLLVLALPVLALLVLVGAPDGAVELPLPPEP
ncbi:MAG: hypothetical protein ACR2LF_06205 [Jatrophihabitantaceae bacterium]